MYDITAKLPVDMERKTLWILPFRYVWKGKIQSGMPLLKMNKRLFIHFVLFSINFKISRNKIRKYSNFSRHYLIRFSRFIHAFLCLLQPLVERSTNSVYYSRPLLLKPRATLIHFYMLLAGTSRTFTRWPRSFWRVLRISWHLSQNL